MDLSTSRIASKSKTLGIASKSKTQGADAVKKVRTKRPGTGRQAQGDAPEYWKQENDFLFYSLGASLGIENIQRFSYFGYSSGGGFFLIPYTVVLVFLGIPMFVLEISLGQLSCGVMSTWAFCPFFAGIGQITACHAFYNSAYHIIVMVWASFYLIESFRYPVPWKHCSKKWSTFYCTDHMVDVKRDICVGNISFFANGTCYDVVSKKFLGIYNRTIAKAHDIQPTFPASEYMKFVSFKYGYSDGLHDIGTINWRLALLLAVLWLFFLLMEIRGIIAVRNLVYVTTIVPLGLFCILVIKSMTLKGSGSGVRHYLYPDVSKVLTADTWKNAVSQVLFSMSLMCRSQETLARHNRFHYNFIRAAVIVVLVNAMVSFFGGIFVFSLIGSYAGRTDSSVKEIVDSGLKLIFVVLPQELAWLNWANGFNILFFILTVSFLLWEHFLLFHGFISFQADQFHLSPRIRIIFSISLCALMYSIGLTLTTFGGVYIYTFLDSYCFTWNAAVTALLMTIAISVSGLKRFCKSIKRMVGTRPLFSVKWRYMKWYFIISYTVTTPVFLLIYLFTLLLRAVEHAPGSFEGKAPPWVVTVGLLLGCIAIACFFIDFIPRLLNQKGNVKKRLKALFQRDPRWGYRQEEAGEKTKTGGTELGAVTLVKTLGELESQEPDSQTLFSSGSDHLQDHETPEDPEDTTEQTSHTIDLTRGFYRLLKISSLGIIPGSRSSRNVSKMAEKGSEMYSIASESSQDTSKNAENDSSMTMSSVSSMIMSSTGTSNLTAKESSVSSTGGRKPSRKPIKISRRKKKRKSKAKENKEEQEGSEQTEQLKESRRPSAKEQKSAEQKHSSTSDLFDE